jgi:hypothetical protein
VQLALTRNGCDIRMLVDTDHVNQRRAFLKNNQIEQYEKCVTENMTAQRNKTVGMSKYCFTQLQIPEQLWPANMQFYLQNPQMKQQFDLAQQKLIQEIEAALVFDETKPCLTKEEALKHIRFMEEQKMEAVKTI